MGGWADADDEVGQGHFGGRSPGSPRLASGGYLDLRSGRVYAESATDPMMVGEGAAIDVEEEPGRRLLLNRTGSRNGWQDMADFAERQHNEALRGRLGIAGKGAFARFRDLVPGEHLSDQWYAFSTDRQIGRAREFLADNCIRVG